MPRGLIRYQLSGDFHFVTFSCYHRLPYLGTPDARDLFERSLETMRVRYELFVAGYVVMPEHVHLLVSEPRHALLAKALQALKLSVAVQSRQRPYWQRRYYDFNVYSEAKRVEKLRYMHRNPIARGLVFQPQQWAWSSFSHWAKGEVGTVEIESQWTARRRGGLPEGLLYLPDTPQSHISEARCGAPASEEVEFAIPAWPTLTI
jgi:putative transposase